jgi:hypothetical protein
MGNSRITTPFGAQSSAAEVIEGIDLSGRRVIVTSGSSGIGVAASALDPGNAARLWQLSVESLASEGSRSRS